MTGKMNKKLQEGRNITVIVNVLPPKPRCKLRHENGMHWAGGVKGWETCDNI